MFRSRARPSVLSLITKVVWPKSGWRRAGGYLMHRLHRLPGTPYSIAAGLASGVAMSMTPFIGVHFFMAGGLAWLIRGNVLASAFGTIAGNPWTFPVIWISSHRIGTWMLGEESAAAAGGHNFSDMFSALVRSLIEGDGDLFLDQVWPVWWPMILGCIPLTLIAWIGVYTLFYRPIEVYQVRRRAKRLSRQQQHASVEQQT
jgi:uncharacterized protein (DUF2062 family)